MSSSANEEKRNRREREKKSTHKTTLEIRVGSRDSGMEGRLVDGNAGCCFEPVYSLWPTQRLFLFFERLQRRRLKEREREKPIVIDMYDSFRC